MGLDQVIEIGIVTDSIEKTVAEFEKMGVSDWTYGEFDTRVVPESRINGKEDYFYIKSATHKHGDIAFEVIEPQMDCFYKDFLKEHGTGVHHIAFKPKDGYVSFVDEFKANGGQVAMELTAMKTIPALGYMDTFKALGFFLELHNDIEH